MILVLRFSVRIAVRSCAFALLLRPECNFLASWDRGAYSRFRGLAIHLVLMTDLAKHFEATAALDKLDSRDTESFLGKRDRTLDPQSALTIAIKAADLGHSVKPWALHYKWTCWVTDEFFAVRSP